MDIKPFFSSTYITAQTSSVKPEKIHTAFPQGRIPENKPFLKDELYGRPI